MRRALLLCVALVAAASGPAAGQIPDTFTNLQVFPKDVPKAELVAAMRSFAGALGVRCNHCHVGSSPTSLEGFDFASDAKEPKKVARAMMRMTREINARLLPETGRSPLVQVRCVTCHRGVTRPEPLVDVLKATAAKGGVPAALARYRELREKHHGRGAYDFGAPTLNQLAESLAESDLAGAIAVQAFNLEANPGIATSHALLGRLLEKKGDRAGALAEFERAAALDPKEEFFRKKVMELKQPPAEKPREQP